MTTPSQPGPRSKGGHGWRGKAFEAITGRPTGSDLRSQLIAAYGPSAKGGVNTRAAAAALGVSQRTVQRWVTTAQEKTRPRPGVQAQLAKQVRQAATTQKGRRAALAGSPQRNRHTRYGAKIRISGSQGPNSSEYLRDRTIEWALDPEAMAGVYSAYEQGGDKALLQYLEVWGGGDDERDGHYVNGWFFDGINSLEIE